MSNFDAFKTWIQDRVARTTDRGASLVEYALLVALIAVVCIVAVTTLGTTANEKFDDVNEGLTCEADQSFNDDGECVDD
jgi:pilus assembly protein Flp/PilA